VTPSSARFSAFEANSPRGLPRQPRASFARLVQSIVPVLKQRTPLSAQHAAAFKNSQWRRDLNQSARRFDTAASRGGARRSLVQSTWTRTERAKLLTTHAKSRSHSLLIFLFFNLVCVYVCVCVCACPVSLGGPEKQNSRGEKGEYVGVCLLVEALSSAELFSLARDGGEWTRRRRVFPDFCPLPAGCAIMA